MESAIDRKEMTERCFGICRTDSDIFLACADTFDNRAGTGEIYDACMVNSAGTDR